MAEARRGVENERNRERASGRKRERKCSRVRGEVDEGARERTRDGAAGCLPLAVCVFNFPGPFCMQISSVIYPRAEAGEGEDGNGMTKECTCGE